MAVPTSSRLAGLLVGRRSVALAAVLIVVAGLLAYSDSLFGPFIFDDVASITDNPTIRHLSAMGDVLSPPSNGEGVSGRPLINLSLAINYAVSGRKTWSYHALNLLIHIMAGLALFGIVRRTLVNYQVGATIPAFAIGLLWTVHPLLTESVTFVIQRTESLMGLFYLLTLYCFIRGSACGDLPAPASANKTAGQVGARAGRLSETASTNHERGRVAWLTISVVCCLLGMAAKEVMVSAPVMVFLFDRTFVAGSFRDAWRRRRGFYLGLAATWLLLGWLLVRAGGTRGEAAGLGLGISAWDYLLTQCRAIVLYLRLSIWPHPLVVDYGTPVVKQIGLVLAQALLIMLLLAGSVFAVIRRSPFGFLGAWFFVTLAPSSSVIPLVTQTIAEHRMYLPLAAIATLFVMALQSLAGWRGMVLCLALAVVLSGLTFSRNRVYRTELAIWEDTVAKQPGNPRAQNGVGAALVAQGQMAMAIPYYEEALRLKPDYAEAHNNLAVALHAVGRHGEAIAQFKDALQLKPGYSVAYNNLGRALADTGRLPEALVEFENAIELEPKFVDARLNLAIALSNLGRIPEAIAQCEEARRIDPDNAKVYLKLGSVMAHAGRLPEAVDQFQKAARLDPADAEAHDGFGLSLAQIGRISEAMAEFQTALRLNPKLPDAHLNLGIALAALHRLPEAMSQFEETLRLDPGIAMAHCNLGTVLAQTGRPDEAIVQLREALRLNPDYPEADNILGEVLENKGQTSEAIACFAAAVKLRPNFLEAQKNLEEASRAAGNPQPILP